MRPPSPAGEHVRRLSDLEGHGVEIAFEIGQKRWLADSLVHELVPKALFRRNPIDDGSP